MWSSIDVNKDIERRASSKTASSLEVYHINDIPSALCDQHSIVQLSLNSNVMKL